MSLYKVVASLALLFAVSSASAGEAYETGVLRDEAGATDGRGATVDAVSGMMGVEDASTGEIAWQIGYLMVTIPVSAESIASIEVLDESDEVMEMLSQPIIGSVWNDENAARLKLYVPYQAGFEFRLRVVTRG